MKATGILRRIDELGRVVIPKEIRKTMKMREGEELEIFTNDEEVVLKKYSELSSLETFCRSLVSAICKVTGKAAAVTDGDKIIASAGKGAPQAGDRIGEDLHAIIATRRRTILQEEKCLPMGALAPRSEVIQPVLAAGDLFGALLFISEEPLGKADEQIAAMGATFLEQQINR